MNIGAENHYEILGISPGADDETVKHAFRDLAKTYHPDYNPGDEAAEQRFKQVNIAYESLKDEARRQAYNEWLAFAERRKNFKRVQWGRLVALIVVLLLGPSAILFWLAMPRDISVVQAPVEIPPPLVARTEPDPRRPAAPREETARKPKEETVRKEPEAAAAPGSTQAKASPPPSPGTTQVKSPPAAPERDEARKPEVAAAPDKDASAKAAADTKDSARQTPKRYEVFLKDRTQPAETKPQPAETPPAAGGDITHSVPRTQPGGNTGGELEGAAAADAVFPQTNGGGGDGSARNAARLLAELKEPGRSSDPQPPSAIQPLPVAPKTLASRPDGSDAEPFKDCPACPVMSLTRRTVPAKRATDLAVSQEVTVRQWEACVADRICTPYRPVDGDPSGLVVGISERAASQYAHWLSGITGYPYTVVTRISGAQRIPAGDDCVERGQRQTSGGWDWLDDQPGPDCAPSIARNRPREKQQGFRVSRPVSRDG